MEVNRGQGQNWPLPISSLRPPFWSASWLGSPCVILYNDMYSYCARLFFVPKSDKTSQLKSWDRTLFFPWKVTGKIPMEISQPFAHGPVPSTRPECMNVPSFIEQISSSFAKSGVGESNGEIAMASLPLSPWHMFWYIKVLWLHNHSKPRVMIPEIFQMYCTTPVSV